MRLPRNDVVHLDNYLVLSFRWDQLHRGAPLFFGEIRTDPLSSETHRGSPGSLKNELRIAALENDADTLNTFVKSKLPDMLNSSIIICNLTDPCKLPPDILIPIIDKDIYVEETIISSEAGLEDYTGPKKVKLFVWEKD
jgi:hypothetical protein